VYIACPRCDWQPTHSYVWRCSCGHTWHTFDTHGVCPACGRVWTMTQCSPFIGCGAWSDHEEWYHDDEELTVEEVLAAPRWIPVDDPASG